MEKRVYSRAVIDIPTVVEIKLLDMSTVEYQGIIHNISESGIQLRINADDYIDLVNRLNSGDVVGFNARDEYDVLGDSREDIVEGHAEVVWINNADAEMTFGCKLNHIHPEYLSYVKTKKLALFINGDLEIGINSY